MKVRAKMLGYYGGRRYREGEEFVIVEREGHRKLKTDVLEKIELSVQDQFSEKWMEPVDGEAPVKKEKKSRAEKKEEREEKREEREEKKAVKKAAKKASKKVEEPVEVSDADDEVI